MWGISENYPHAFEIKDGEEKIASFYSDNENGKYLCDLISLLVKKELDKKKIGNEVLGLYREINMIYDFSEMISEKIDVESIAKTALTEASKIIDSTFGLFLMYDSETDLIKEIVSFGYSSSKNGSQEIQNIAYKKIISTGTSSIINSQQLSEHPMLSHLKNLMYSPLKVKHRTLGILMLGHQDDKEFTAAELKLLTTITLQTASAIESAHLYQKGLNEAKEREDAIRKIHDVSLKFVPFEFLRSLGKEKLTEVSLGDQVEREVTVLFSDIRDFTTMSENIEPKDNFLFINSFNKRMGPIVRRNNGFILQYLGDGFMAIFPEGSQDALRASVEMHNALKSYNGERIDKNRNPIKVGIGMQNGKLIMGITGDIERLDPAIISDTVNTASRIEGLSKHYGASILLTEECKKSLTSAEEFDFRYLGLVQVKGKKKPLKIYECINGDGNELFDHKIETLPIFEEAMSYYFNKEFAMAAVTFQQILKKNNQDHTAKLFLNKSAHLITQDLSEDWIGVDMMKLK